VSERSESDNGEEPAEPQLPNSVTPPPTPASPQAGIGFPPLFPPVPGQTAYSFYASLYAGSLPPHDFAEGWAKLVPDAGERMFKMTEDEAEHRRWMDRTFVYYRFLAQAGTLLLLGIVLVGGIYLIANGKKVYGLATIIGEFTLLALVLLVRQFASGRSEPEELGNNALPLPQLTEKDSGSGEAG